MRFAFGDCLLDIDRRELRCRGERVALEPQVFDLLTYLIENRDRVVNKNDLFAHVWRGRMVSDSAFMSRLSAARAAVGDSGAAQHVIRTIPRTGVRFVAEVSVETPADAPASGSTLALPDKPSIAVLPFQNLSDDPAQDYFADGMVEEITTALSRIHWLFVIARNSAFAYKGQAIDVRRVGRELGVRYVLEGSVRKSGSRLRITAQLIEAQDATHLWAERFDGSLEDVFDLQDEVATRVTGAIEPELLLAEIERAGRKPTESLDAYDLYLRALAQFHRYDDASLTAAASLARAALATDPTYGRAAALVGLCQTCRITLTGRAVSPDETAEAVRLARWALASSQDDPEAAWSGAYTLALFTGDHAVALDRVDWALRLNPNAAFVWSVRGWLKALADQPDTAVESFERSLRLSPFDPLAWNTNGGMSLAALIAGRFEAAIDWANRSLRAHPSYLTALRYKAIACALLGRMDEARDCVGLLLASQPDFTISGWLSAYAAKAYSAETAAILRDGLRLAGAPD